MLLSALLRAGAGDCAPAAACLPLPADWCLVRHRWPVQSLPADVRAAERRTAVLLAAVEAGMRLHPKLASGRHDVLSPSASLSKAAVAQFGELLHVLLERLQGGTLDAAAAAAAEGALRAAAGLAGTLHKLLLQGRMGGEETQMVRSVLDNALPAYAGIMCILTAGEDDDCSLRPSIPLSTAR